MTTTYDPREEARVPLVTDTAREPTRYGVNIVENDRLKTCISVFRRFPWLTNTVDNIFVQPIRLPNRYYDENNFSEKFTGGQKFYRVKLPYYQMRCLGKVTDISDDNTLTVDYDNEMLQFRVGFQVRDKFLIQNKSMFESEEKYLNMMNNSNLNITELKNAQVGKILRQAAVSTLSDVVPDQEYAEIVVGNIENTSTTAYEFAYKVYRIVICAKYGNLFGKRLRRGYYAENIVHLLDYDVLLEGVDTTDPAVIYRIEDYIEDSALTLLMYADRTDYIPTRKYQRDTRPPLNLNKLDLKNQCANFEDVRDVSEENLAFFGTDSDNNRFFCYDILQLYADFKAGNTTDPYTGKPFPDYFVQKIENMYQFKVNLNPTLPLVSGSSMSSSDYDDIVQELERVRLKDTNKGFLKVLEKVREEIDRLNISDDFCATCQKKVGRTGGIITLNKQGEILKHCSKQCFDR